MMDRSLVPKESQEQEKEGKVLEITEMAGNIGLINKKEKGQMMTLIKEGIDKGII